MGLLKKAESGSQGHFSPGPHTTLHALGPYLFSLRDIWYPAVMNAFAGPRPRVSVIIPAYNRAAFLKEALESVLNQTYPNQEIIIVDDGSTEDQEKFLGAFAGLYDFIRQAHQGVSAARNRGIMAAGGVYVAFLDSDDLWKADKIEKQVRRMESSPGLLFGHTDEIWIRNGRRVNPMKKHRKTGGPIFLECLPLCLISPSSVIIRRTLFDSVGLFDESLPVCEDYDFWLRATRKHAVDYLDEKLIVKRGGHSDQLSRKYWGMDRFRVHSLAHLLKKGDLSPGHRQAVLRIFREKCRILSEGSMKRGKVERGLQYAQLARLFDAG